MSPDDMSERLAAWARDPEWQCAVTRRVVCVEQEGPRRTWTLYEGGRQVGHVRLRLWQGLEGQREWLCEASRRTRQALGLDDTPQPGQTDPGQSR